MNLSVEEKTHVLIALKNLRKKALDSTVDYPDCGICVNLASETCMFKWTIIGEVSCINLVSEYSKGWEHHCGLRYNPVNDKGDIMWEGENLKMRINLIDYICDRLERELNI